MADFTRIDRYLQENRQSHLDELLELLRIPSISAHPERRNEMLVAAHWVSSKLGKMGLKVELLTDPDQIHPPIVYAETPPLPNAPTVLVYGHYDVQPCDPMGEWISPPFSPEIRDGNIYARGATDDKGQMLTHLQALHAWKDTEQRLPIQLKYLIEGQEESGSELLAKLLPEIAKKICCDAMVISDSSQYAKNQPAVTYGLRGIAYYEIRVHGPRVDLHSGSFGGAITNPSLALARILTDMKSADGKIQLPGFYDSVKPLAEVERQAWQELGFSDEEFAAQLGVPALAGEIGYSTLERRWARPTFDVHGLLGGYQGEGGKTIIPAWAGAKISFRLVPNQDPKEITRQLQQFIDQHTPVGVTVEVIDLHGGHGVVADIESKFMAGAKRAVSEGFGVEPKLIREGGSIPIVADMVQVLDCDLLLLGWGLDDDGAHSPNEKFALEDYYRGIRASARLWQYLAE